MDMTYEANERKPFKQVPVGTHTGICYLIADIGTQEETFEGVTSQKKKIYFGWETPDEKTDDGKPLIVFKSYTLSFNEKATLAKDYKSWTKETEPKKFNIGALLGKGCNLSIGATSGGNAKVIGVTSLKAKEQVPNLVAEPVLFDMRNPSEDALSRLPGFIKDKIVASPEYQAWVLNRNTPIEETLNDQVPF